MSGETAGQLACIAWNEHYAEQHGIEARNEWAASDPRGRGAWEAAAATVETEQVRLARQDRDQLRKHVLDLAAGLEGSAAQTAPSKKSGIENDLAAKLRQVAEPPS